MSPRGRALDPTKESKQAQGLLSGQPTPPALAQEQTPLQIGCSPRRCWHGLCTYVKVIMESRVEASRFRSIRHCTAWLWPLCLVLVLPAASQEPVPKGEFAEQITVRVLNFEAVVTDRDGQRVPSLTPASSHWLVGGEEVPIEYFNEVRDGQVISSADDLTEVSEVGILRAVLRPCARRGISPCSRRAGPPVKQAVQRLRMLTEDQ